MLEIFNNLICAMPLMLLVQQAELEAIMRENQERVKAGSIRDKGHVGRRRRSK